MIDNLTLTAPERIYLWAMYTESREVDFEEANWSTEQRGECHVEYVRADLVPTWKDSPDSPGLWVRRQFWIDDDRAYDRDMLFDFVGTASGFRFIGSDKGLYEIQDSTITRSRWFGPIPTDGDK